MINGQFEKNFGEETVFFSLEKFNKNKNVLSQQI